MSVPPVIIDLVGMLPSQLVFAYAMTRLLDIAYPRVYWTIELASLLGLVWVRPMMDPALKFACGMLICFLPLFLSRGKFWNRLFVNVLAVAILDLCELPAGLLWIEITGAPNADYGIAGSRFPAIIFTSAMHLFLLVLLLLVLYAAMRRLRNSGDDWGTGLFVWFPVIQLVLLILLAWISLSYFPAAGWVYLIASLLAVACIAADVLIFRNMEAYRQKKAADRQAANLEKQATKYLS